METVTFPITPELLLVSFLFSVFDLQDANSWITPTDAQIRYANGTKKIIENFLEGKEQNPADMIVENG